jgi:hypothetical protein
MVELHDVHFKKAITFLFILEQIRIYVAKYSEFWSLYVYRVHPHVPSLTTHNRVQNKHVKIFYRCSVLCLCTFQRVLKTHLDSRGLDWTRLGRCVHPVTLESNWTGLDSTRLCWCERTQTRVCIMNSAYYACLF